MTRRLSEEEAAHLGEDLRDGNIGHPHADYRDLDWVERDDSRLLARQWGEPA